jgi:hypothetical protein
MSSCVRTTVRSSSSPPVYTKLEAVETATKAFRYDRPFYGIPLDTWVQRVHKNYCERVHYFPLKKGSYAYDDLAMGIGYLFTNFVWEEKTYCAFEFSELNALITEGRKINFNYWKQEEPWLKPTYKYYESVVVAEQQVFLRDEYKEETILRAIVKEVNKLF